MNDIDTALIDAIRASAITKPKKTGKRCQLVAFVSDDDVLHASADRDRSKLIPFAAYINTRAANV
jgi:hypothetical protein